jgi:hypothetical protein
LAKYVDPQVSRIKFGAEISQFKSIQNEYIKRGIWLLKDEYPTALVVFAKALSPPAVIFGALIDFTDYDLRPLSVTLVNPFTQVALKSNEVMTQFQRLIPPHGAIPVATAQALLQTHSDNKPFICLPGLREYHEHPAHTGDSWLLHRGLGEGTLHFVVENLHRYGVEGIVGYGMAINIAITNFQANPIE